MRLVDLREPTIRQHLTIAIVAITIVSSGCVGNPPPVPVFASRADWESLAGRWRGSYTTSAPNRRGLIDFTLSASDERRRGREDRGGAPEFRQCSLLARGLVLVWRRIFPVAREILRGVERAA